MAVRRIGVLTSGGDCAGLNAVLRAVTMRGTALGYEVWGIQKGTQGLFTRPPEAQRLLPRQFDGTVLRRGGTILGTTNRGDPFAFPMPDGSEKDRSEEVLEGLRLLHIDALIGIGGDGSLAILRRLCQQGGIPLVGVPKTIDNDLGPTEVSVGHATAVEVATLALDHLQPTAASHGRIMVLEVMGRDAGHIALSAGIAGGADVILIPEIPYRMSNIVRHLEMLRAEGRDFALVMVAEAVKDEASGQAVTGASAGAGSYGGIGYRIAHQLAELTGWETRVTVLGHLQRGAPPGARDRLMGQIFGVHAVDLVAEGSFDRMVAWTGRNVVSVPLAEAVAEYKAVDPAGPAVRTARGLGICLGDEGGQEAAG